MNKGVKEKNLFFLHKTGLAAAISSERHEDKRPSRKSYCPNTQTLHVLLPVEWLPSPGGGMVGGCAALVPR